LTFCAKTCRKDAFTVKIPVYTCSICLKYIQEYVFCFCFLWQENQRYHRDAMCGRVHIWSRYLNKLKTSLREGFDTNLSRARKRERGAATAQDLTNGSQTVLCHGINSFLTYTGTRAPGKTPTVSTLLPIPSGETYNVIFEHI
jgi:hypothetical protein